MSSVLGGPMRNDHEHLVIAKVAIATILCFIRVVLAGMAIFGRSTKVVGRYGDRVIMLHYALKSLGKPASIKNAYLMGIPICI